MDYAMFRIITAAITFLAGIDAQDLYQWNCSSLDTSNNLYTLPDLNYEDDENVRNNRNFFVPTIASEVDTGVDIFRVPSSLNCQGTVSAVEFCYFSARGDIEFSTDYHVFTLVILEESNLNFTVTGAIDVLSIPTSRKCSDTSTLFQGVLRFCCDNVPLSREDQFSLPRANFAFGIIPISTTITQLSYSTLFSPEFQVEKFTINSSIPDVGRSFLISPDSRVTDEALRLFQFVIGELSATVLKGPEQKSYCALSVQSYVYWPRTISSATPSTSYFYSWHTSTDMQVPSATALATTFENTLSNSTGQMSDQLSSGVIAGITAGGSGALILSVLITTIVLCTVIFSCKKKVSTSMATHPNEAYSMHPNHPNLEAEALYDDVNDVNFEKNSKSWSTENNTSFADEAYGVHSDHLQSNEAYGIHNDRFSVSTNHAYGVTTTTSQDDAYVI